MNVSEKNFKYAGPTAISILAVWLFIIHFRIKGKWEVGDIILQEENKERLIYIITSQYVIDIDINQLITVCQN